MITARSKQGREYRFPDLRGMTFGRLEVLSYDGRKADDHRWICRCSCGTEKSVPSRSLRRGLTKSCGCLQREAAGIRGAAHHLYRGGKSHDANGYVTLTSKEHGESRQMREHRDLMQRHLGRKLHRDEIVHHKNGDKSDNRLENLELMSRAEHARHHHKR